MSPELLANIGRRASAALATAGTIAILTSATPAQAGGSYTTDCVHGYGRGFGGSSCTEIWRDRLTNPYVIAVPQPRSEEAIADSATRERLWQALCRPVIRQDHYGVRRYIYAAPGCDVGRYE